MPRYELSEGSSNKFWEIKLSGKSFTTTYGKTEAIDATIPISVVGGNIDGVAAPLSESMSSETTQDDFDITVVGASTIPVALETSPGPKPARRPLPPPPRRPTPRRSSPGPMRWNGSGSRVP